MWIVRVALNRPYTFVVLALLILLVSPLVILRTPTDIFPNIGIPVVSVIWSYDGFPPQEMSDRIVTITERSITTTVNDIEHMESQSYNGIGVIKLFFRPSVTIATALAQVTAICQTQLRQLPPGTTAPLILSYSASTVPVLQIGLSSTRLSEQQLFDLGANTMRTQLATVQGASVPWPYGGKTAAGFHRYRFGGHAGQGALADRCGERRQRGKPDSAVRHRQARAARIPGGNERQHADHQRAERSAGQDPQRRNHLYPRRGARARRLLAADQYRAAGRPPQRAAQRLQDRLGVHAGDRARCAGGACRIWPRDCRRS